jgi:DNA-binding NarL/FixJ family response regulator
MRVAGPPSRVLVVVGHAVFADALALALDADAEIEVVDAVSSVNDALAAATSLRPDVILVDHGLRDGRALSFVTALRERAPRTKVILLTGRSDDRLAVGAVEAGCSGLVGRDRRLPDLVRAVKAAQAGDGQFSPAVLASVLERAEAVRSTPLTSREREVLDLVAQGRTNRQIAEQLTLSLHTIRNHVQSILRKLGAHSKLEAVAVASRRGLVSR